MDHSTARTKVQLAIDEARCHMCGECLARQSCRGNAIRFIDRGEPPFLDMSRCWGCLVCVQTCPHEAVIRRP